MSNTITTQKNTSKKFKAILAGGVVLGVGAAVTLAAWTDQEWASGAFTAGTFDIESSVDGKDFKDHNPDEDGVAELDFNLQPKNLSPNQTVAAPFVLRVDNETTLSAEVELVEATSDKNNPNFKHLTYGIIEVPNASACEPGAEGTPIVPKATALNSAHQVNDIVLTPGADEAAGDPITLCFQVTADGELEQSHATTASWQFVGESISAE